MTSRHCGKRVYEGKKSARDAHRKAGFRIRVYWCRWCCGWHVAADDKSDKNLYDRKWREEGEWGN